MRVTLLNQFYAPDISPTAQLAASLAEHRAERGDEVTVITGRAGYLEGIGGTRTSRPRAGLVRVRRAWTPDLGKSTIGRRLLGYATYLAGATVRVLLLPAQDAIVVMTTPPFVVVVALLHTLLHPRSRVVLWSMDCYPDAAERFDELRPGGPMSRALKAVNRWAFRRLAHVVVLDGAMGELLSTQYAAGPGRPPTTVIPNWERASLFPAGEAPAPWPGWRELVTDDPTVIVYLGNIGVGHRFDTVVDAAQHLGDDALFVFVGGGARREALEREVTERGLEGNVRFVDYIPKEDTASLMAGADAALITLDERSLGIMSPSKLHANLAAGLPVLYIGPPGSNVDEAIGRFDCGASLREGDVVGVIDFVRSLRQPGAQSLRVHARQAFDEAYCDLAVLPQFDAILDV
jgi:glycosyltransferase involved in cell wall biosynthesis